MTTRDFDILRRLGERKAAAAQHPVNLARKADWLRLDAGLPGYPMVLIFPEEVVDRNSPLSSANLECEDEFLRSVEIGLRRELYHFEQLKDDFVIEARLDLKWELSISGFGVDVVFHSTAAENGFGARSWTPPLTDLEKDFDLLKPRRFAVDRESTWRKQELLERIFKEQFPVAIRGRYATGVRLTARAIDLVGLENFMLVMYDDPEGLHRLMAFLRDDHRNYLRWLEREGLLSLNNRNDMIGSGSIGYTDALPQADNNDGAQVRLKDMWGFSDSQETVSISQEMFEEFVLPYVADLARNFGRLYYGCCEPLHGRIASVLQAIPTVTRVSVSPWADEEVLARELGAGLVYSRKPNPTLISTPACDEEAIRKDLRRTLAIARGHPLEIVMKDLHTLCNQPARAARWVELAREEIASAS
jgi:hypothetical protein